jgi:hypothetical protein
MSKWLGYSHPLSYKVAILYTQHVLAVAQASHLLMHPPLYTCPVLVVPISLRVLWAPTNLIPRPARPHPPATLCTVASLSLFLTKISFFDQYKLIPIAS